MIAYKNQTASKVLLSFSSTLVGIFFEPWASMKLYKFARIFVLLLVACAFVGSLAEEQDAAKNQTNVQNSPQPSVGNSTYSGQEPQKTPQNKTEEITKKDENAPNITTQPPPATNSSMKADSSPQNVTTTLASGNPTEQTANNSSATLASSASPQNASTQPAPGNPSEATPTNSSAPIGSSASLQNITTSTASGNAAASSSTNSSATTPSSDPKKTPESPGMTVAPQNVTMPGNSGNSTKPNVIDAASTSGMGGWGIFGIIIIVIVVLVGSGYAIFYYKKNRYML